MPPLDSVMSSVAYNCLRLLRQSNLVLSVLGRSRIARNFWDPSLVSPQTQAPMRSRRSLGYPGILPWCSLRQKPPCCLEDPLDIPGSSLDVPSDTGLQAVWRIPGPQPLQFKTLTKYKYKSKQEVD